MKIIRDYLTSDELGFVVSEVVKKTNSVEREIVKVGVVLQLLYDELGEYNNCLDIYDKAMAEHIDISKEVFNYNTLEKLIEQETGTTNVIAEFLMELNDKIDTLSKEVDSSMMEGLIEQLKEVKDNG